MKRCPIALAASLLIAPSVCRPQPAAVLSAMEKVADWQIAHPGHEKTDGWIQGAFYAGLSALDGMAVSPRYHAALLSIGNANSWRPATSRATVYNADDMCVGQMYLEMYLRDRDPRMIEATKKRCDFILAHPPRETSLEFTREESKARFHWSWCDSLFMGPPVWVRLYAATGNRAYLDYAVDNWWKSSAYLYDPSEHLYFRDSTYFDKREANGAKVFWGRGNGWVLAGLARVLEYLPASEPSRPRFEKQFKDMAARVRELQQPDGFWRASLLDPKAFPTQEASGTGFFCFGLAWGINHGLLDRSGYAPVAFKAWQALLGCVQPDGKMIHVQPVGGAPGTFPPGSTEPYGPGAFLLAGSEIYTLAGG